MSARRVLLLSGSTGKGHDTLADACAETFSLHGIQSRTLDSMALLGGGFAAAGDWVFRRLMSVSAVYDAFHFSGLRVGSALARWMDSTAVNVMYPAFRDALEDFPPDLILAVFATGAGAAGRYKEERGDVPTAVFITDAVAHRMWVHEGIDLFLVTSSAAAASVRRYQPRARVEIVTAPVRAGFYAPPPREAAREELGVAQGEPCVLLMSGSWGVGPLDAAAALLAARGVHVLAVAGENAKLRARLDAAASEDGRVHPFGYTDRIPELMAAADVVVTSSGDTCREARAVGRRLVLLDVVPGHGRENLMHELELGGALVASLDPESLADTVAVALADVPEPSPVGSAAEWGAQFGAALSAIGFALA